MEWRIQKAYLYRLKRLKRLKRLNAFSQKHTFHRDIYIIIILI